MKSCDVVGYTADATVWCPDCAFDRYGSAACGLCPECGEFIYPEATDVCLECGYDYSKDSTTDREGNPVHAVFAGDEWEFQPCCAGCWERIDVNVFEYQ